VDKTVTPLDEFNAEYKIDALVIESLMPSQTLKCRGAVSIGRVTVLLSNLDSFREYIELAKRKIDSVQTKE
jgi:hypothetical protein